MANQALFIVKLFVISTILSVAIKFAPLSIALTTTNVLICVLSPTVIMAIAFLWRYAAISKQKTN